MKAPGVMNETIIDMRYKTTFKGHHLECHKLRASYSFFALNVVKHMNKKNI